MGSTQVSIGVETSPFFDKEKKSFKLIQ